MLSLASRGTWEESVRTKQMQSDFSLQCAGIFPPSFQLTAALKLPKEKVVLLYLTALLEAVCFPMHFCNWAFNLLMPKVGSFYQSPLPRSPFASSSEVYSVSLP